MVAKTLQSKRRDELVAYLESGCKPKCRLAHWHRARKIWLPHRGLLAFAL